MARGDIAAAEGSVCVRTSAELATEVDGATNGTVWTTAPIDHLSHRIPAT